MLECTLNAYNMLYSHEVTSWLLISYCVVQTKNWHRGKRDESEIEFQLAVLAYIRRFPRCKNRTMT